MAAGKRTGLNRPSPAQDMPRRRCHSQSQSAAAQPARGAGAHVGTDQDTEVKSLMIGSPGKKLSWQPLSLDILGEGERR